MLWSSWLVFYQYNKNFILSFIFGLSSNALQLATRALLQLLQMLHLLWYSCYICYVTVATLCLLRYGCYTTFAMVWWLGSLLCDTKQYKNLQYILVPYCLPDLQYILVPYHLLRHQGNAIQLLIFCNPDWFLILFGPHWTKFFTFKIWSLCPWVELGSQGIKILH